MKKNIITIAILAALSLTGCDSDKQTAENLAPPSNPFAAKTAAASATPGTVTMTTEQLAAIVAAAKQAAPVAATATTAPVVHHVHHVQAVQAAYQAPQAPQPVFETRTSRVCAPREVTVQIDVEDPVKPVEHSTGAMLLGGLAGGLLGHNVGGGTGRTLLTVAGAAGGAFAGDALANNNKPVEHTSHKENRTSVVTECREVTEQVRTR